LNPNDVLLTINRYAQILQMSPKEQFIAGQEASLVLSYIDALRSLMSENNELAKPTFDLLLGPSGNWLMAAEWAMNIHNHDWPEGSLGTLLKARRVFTRIRGT